MTVWIGGLVSVGAAALFFIGEPYLLDMPAVWRVIACLTIFAVAIGLALYLHARGRGHRASGDTSFAKNQVGKNFHTKIEDSEASKTPSSKKFSENEVGGNMHIDVKNSNI